MASTEWLFREPFSTTPPPSQPVYMCYPWKVRTMTPFHSAGIGPSGWLSVGPSLLVLLIIKSIRDMGMTLRSKGGRFFRLSFLIACHWRQFSCHGEWDAEWLWCRSWVCFQRTFSRTRRKLRQLSQASRRSMEASRLPWSTISWSNLRESQGPCRESRGRPIGCRSVPGGEEGREVLFGFFFSDW